MCENTSVCMNEKALVIKLKNSCIMTQPATQTNSQGYNKLFKKKWYKQTLFCTKFGINLKLIPFTHP